VPPEAHHPHESPPVMTVPLIVLAVGSVLVGLVFEGAAHWFSGILAESTAFVGQGCPPEHHTNWLLPFGRTLAAAGGIGLAAYLYYQRPMLPLLIAHAIRPAYNLSLHRFHFDEIYNVIVVRPLNVLAAVSRFFDSIIDGIVDLVGALPRLVAKA